MGRPPKNSLSFFKVFIKDTCSDRMKIPPAYTLHMLGTLLQMMVSLRDQYGNHWPVKLANIENQLYFEEGWAKFVEDNSIETGDFIFFQYNDNKVFYVKLTGRNGCDKKGVGARKSKERDDERMEAETVDEEMEEQENQPPLEEQVDEKKEEGNNEELEEQEDQLHEKQVKRQVKKVGKPKSKDVDRGLRKSSRGKHFVQKRAGAKRGRAKAPDYYGTDIFKSGILPLPKNPYFVTKIRPKRREELYIPVEVLKDHSIKKLPEKATLRDSCGRTWSTKLTHWGDGRKFYVGGWASFCRLNFVGEDDLCICEFVKKDQQDLVIQLQVVPTSNNAMIRRRDQQMA